MTMRLLVRSLGHPAPLELDAPTSASVADFEALLRGSSRLGDGPEDRQRLVSCRDSAWRSADGWAGRQQVQVVGSCTQSSARCLNSCTS